MPIWWRRLLRWVRAWIGPAPEVPELPHDVTARIATFLNPYAYPRTEGGRAELSGVLLALHADRKTYLCMMYLHSRGPCRLM